MSSRFRVPVTFRPSTNDGTATPRPGEPVEVVAIRARASRAAPLSVEELPTVVRPRVEGPDVVIEPDCTVWIPDGWTAEPSALGAWVVARRGTRPSSRS